METKIVCGVAFHMDLYMAYGVYGVYGMYGVYGIWRMVYGVWCMVCGVWVDDVWWVVGGVLALYLQPSVYLQHHTPA
jgi:hypothetical protein